MILAVHWYQPPRDVLRAYEMQDFRRLQVWQAALSLTVAIYKTTRQFPVEERFGLTAQLRSAAASIGANIAEGCGRSSGAELRRFLYIALGSATELRHHLYLAQALEYASPAGCDALIERTDHIGRMLHRLIARLSESRPASRSIPRPAKNE